MPLLCRLRLWIGAVPLCGVVFIESGRDCVRGRIDRRGRRARAAGGNVESVQKEDGDERTDGAMSLYSPACRRSLSFSPSYFMKAEGFSAKMYLRLVGPFRSCHIMTEHYSISLLRHTYPQPILRYETPSLIICRWPSPQFSASLSFAFLLTNSVVKLTTVSVCQSESES